MNLEALRHYGEPQYAFEGKGTFVGGDDDRWECSFEAAQFQDGNCMLLCHGSEWPRIHAVLSGDASQDRAFLGRTKEGFEFSASGLVEVTHLPDVDRSGVYMASRPRRIAIVNREASSLPTVASFGLTNVVFGSRSIEIAHPAAGQLKLHPCHPKIESRLRILRGPMISAWLEVPWAEGSGFLEEVADDICYILSIAMGGKVQWVNRTDLVGDGDDDDRRIRLELYRRPTRRFSGLHTVDCRKSRNIRRYLSETLPVYRSRKKAWKLAAGPIDAFVDGRTEDDYVELRGAKLAVATEMLKTIFLAQNPEREFISSTNQFVGMRPTIKNLVRPVLTDCGLSKEQRRMFYSNLQGLNCVPFSDVIARLCQEIDLTVGADDLQTFVRIRNCLIHHGQFTSQRESPIREREGKKFPTPQAEYYWFVHFVDRLFLRLVGYSGSYFDWSSREFPASREAV